MRFITAQLLRSLENPRRDAYYYESGGQIIALSLHHFSSSILMDLASGPKNGADHDDVDLNQKLEAWEKFYNLNRPHGAFAGKIPYEVLRTLLN